MLLLHVLDMSYLFDLLGGAAKRDLGEIQSPQAVKRPRVSHEIDSQTGVSGTQNSPLPGTVQSGE